MREPIACITRYGDPNSSRIIDPLEYKPEDSQNSSNPCNPAKPGPSGDPDPPNDTDSAEDPDPPRDPDPPGNPVGGHGWTEVRVMAVTKEGDTLWIPGPQPPEGYTLPGLSSPHSTYQTATRVIDKMGLSPAFI